MARWIVHDRYGNQIYMTDERWCHAMQKRPWLSNYLENVLTTIRQGRRQQDPLNPYKYKYYWPCRPLEPEFNHMVVVVLFAPQTDASGQLAPNNYVVNVWAVFLYGNR